MEKIRGVARFKIKPENLQEFKDLSDQCMQDQTECIVYEEYVNSDALVTHFNNMGELAQAIFKIVETDGQLWGNPNAQLAEGLKANNVKVYKPYRSFAD